MKWNNIKIIIVEWFIKFIIVVSTICLIVGAIYKCSNNKQIPKTTSPIETYEIDSITKENDRIIIEVKSLDSIKNAKVIEVKSLDNDSTLKLFYKLIRE